MILRAYILKANGEPLLSRSYEGESGPERADVMPPHIRSCVTLFQSRSSTNLMNAYTQEQGDLIWTYVFFENISVVFLSTPDENPAKIEKKMVSLGKAIAHSYGRIMDSWDGDMGDIMDLNNLIDHYIQMDVSPPDEQVLSDIDELITKVLENHEVAYIGVFDTQGDMVSGNVPESHIAVLLDELSKGVVRSSIELVPTEVKIHQHRVHMLGVQSLTLAVGTYRADSRVKAMSVVSEIAESLNEILANGSTMAK